MVQNTRAASKSGRGRPPAFDRAAVLAGAQRAFYRHGFEATTLADLEAETGVDRSTLYNSFGGKAGIYASAVEQYLQTAEQRLYGPLLTGSAGLDDVLRFLDRFYAGMVRDDVQPGCLVVNDMAADAGQVGSQRFLSLAEGAFREALERAAAAGEIDAAEVRPKARILLLGLVGTNLLSKSTGDSTAVGEAIDAMRLQVRQWQGSAPDAQAEVVPADPGGTA